ncbi:MAG: hypothetical protein NC293_09990 [Roseburia sp.]|nr:hypothetical protein [Roseburia sp.]
MNRKLKRMGKTIVSGLVITGLVLGNGAFIQAEQITKEESVYVSADADGTATKITVSDWLKNAGINGTLNDKSTLKDIKNVKGDETFEQKGDGLAWSAGADDIYYQGTTDKELPVSVKISYKLDGTEMSAEEIAGKSGKVTITVSYTNHRKVKKEINGEKKELYTPFLMATGLILPTEKFSEVEIDHGRIINEGSNNIVVGFGVPGMADSLEVSDEIAEKMPEEFTVTAEVTDFSMGNTITYASAGILSELEIEDDDTFSELEDDIEKLVDSSEELAKGSGKLSDLMAELKDKFDEYADGEKQLNTGINTLAKSGKKLSKGVKDYTKGASDLAGGAKAYVNGAKQITSGNTTLYNAVKDMPGSYKEFSDGIKAYTAGVDQLANKETGDALKSGAASISAGIDTLNTSLSTLETSYENYETLITAIKAQASQIEDETQKATLLAYADSLKQLADGQKASVSALVSATGAESALKTGADQLSEGVGKMVEGAANIAVNSEALRLADGTMTESINALVENVQKLKEGGEKLSKNDQALLTGAKKLQKAGKTLNSGSKKLIKGVGKLKKGSNTLNKATGKVADGIGQLGEGAKKIADGMNQFDKEGIQEINKMYEEDFADLKDRLSALLDISKEYTNFSGIGDGMDGDVKFIIETAEVGKEE